jgi:hypothetical protein
MMKRFAVVRDYVRLVVNTVSANPLKGFWNPTWRGMTKHLSLQL